MRPVIYVFINKGLQMTAGKIAAQAGHAVAMSVINSPQEMRNRWEDTPQRTIIVLGLLDTIFMQNAKEYLEQRNFHMIPIIDEGANEVPPHSWTAMASQIVDKNDPLVEQSFSSFKSYRDTIRVNMEIDR
jgi:peptidyl-tRNA hydrolase